MKIMKETGFVVSCLVCILLAHHASLENQVLGQLNSENYVRITRELAELNPLIDAVKAYRAVRAEIADTESLIADSAVDPEMRGMAEAELETLAARRTELEQQIRVALLPRLFAQRFADQRNAVCRFAALDCPIDEFELLLVEAHNHRSSRHPAPLALPGRPRAQRLDIADRQPEWIVGLRGDPVGASQNVEIVDVG